MVNNYIGKGLAGLLTLGLAVAPIQYAHSGESMSTWAMRMGSRDLNAKDRQLVRDIADLIDIDREAKERDELESQIRNEAEKTRRVVKQSQENKQEPNKKAEVKTYSERLSKDDYAVVVKENRIIYRNKVIGMYVVTKKGWLSGKIDKDDKLVKENDKYSWYSNPGYGDYVVLKNTDSDKQTVKKESEKK